MSNFENLEGLKFGRLTAVSLHSTGTRTKWNCKCECGKYKTVQAHDLKNGDVKSCGCYRIECGYNKLKDLTGKKFHFLYVKGYTRNDKGQIRWICVCDCGKEKLVDGGKLKSGHTKSCGCYSRECLSKRQTKHGLSSNRLYCLWKNIHKRCTYEKDLAYAYYGGKGIKVCQEWHVFEVFKEWCMANGYDDTLTIDRRECDKGYEPDNCRWVTFTDQMRNTSRTLGVEKVLEIKKMMKDGVRMAEIAKLYNADLSGLYKIKNGHTYKGIDL